MMRTFRDILVTPMQGFRFGVDQRRQRKPSGFCRGGPIWPFFALQVGPRHCQGAFPFPCDRRPIRTGTEARTASDGIWCGPVTPHFGHMIRDFASRIARSLDETDVPLVFSLGPDVNLQPALFFWHMLDHLGAGGREVILVREPTRFTRLRVLPQEERFGAKPSPRYLDLLDRSAGRRPRTAAIDRLFVSRALLRDGKFAGERYLDTVLSRLGVVVIHPETLSLEDQLDHYRSARTIVASEGSALHGMQLLGRFDADLIVLVRRRGWEMARPALAARARSLRYWNCIASLIHGCHVHGRPLFERALVLIDRQALIAHLRSIGLDPAPMWDQAGFAEAVRADIVRFGWLNREQNLHPTAMGMIQRCIDAHGLGIDLDAVLRSGAAGPT